MAIATSAAIVKDGGFENDSGCWGTLPDGYSIVPGAGRNGTRALVYENYNPGLTYRFPRQPIEIETGKIYRYSVWIKTEDLKSKDGGASLCIQWTRRDGSIYGAYIGFLKGTKDWTKVEGISQSIPADISKVGFSLFCSKGTCGKAYFDDVEVVPYERKAVSLLCSSVYRDEASDGKVTFHASLNLKPPLSIDNVKAELSYRSGNGVKTIPATVLTTTEAVAELDVGDLPMGVSEVGFKLTDAAGAEIGRTSMQFKRTADVARRRVCIDRYGRTIVDGKPFFPLGMYWSSVINPEKVGIYAKGPFNTVASYVMMDEDQMNLFASNGIKVLYPFEKIFSGTRKAPAEVQTEADEERFIVEHVRRFRNHPALLAWYLNDEMPVSEMRRLVRHYKLVEREDPDHPSWTVLYQVDQLREYLGSFDAIGTDPYPIPGKPLSMAAGHTRKTRQAVFGVRALWQVPQAFDWYSYKKNEEMKRTARMPTAFELRSMTWQMIAEGANGLFYYAWQTLWYKAHGMRFEDGWRDVCKAAGEVKKYADVLLSVEPAPKCDDVPAAWSSRVWRKGPAVYVLLVDVSGKESSAEIRPQCRYGSAVAEFGPTPRLGDGVLQVGLKAYEPVLIRLDAVP